MRARAPLLALLTAGALAFAACGGDDDQDPTPTPPQASPTAETSTPGAATPTAAAPTPTAEPTPVVFEPTFTCDSPITYLEARLRRGEQVELQGPVLGVMDRNGDAILSVGAPLSATLRVEVIVPSGSRGNFPADPLLGFADRTICVRGTVSEIGGVISIAATTPDALTVVAE